MVRFLLVTLTFSYFFCSSPGKVQPGDGELKKQKKTKVSQINQSLKVATRQNLRKFIRKSAGVSLTGRFINR